MNAHPRCYSIPQDLEDEMLTRVVEEKMTRSEYIRKCIREEIQRAKARRLLRFAGEF